MKTGTYILLRDLLIYEKEKSEEINDKDSYCVYWKDEESLSPDLDDEVYIGNYPEIDEDNDYEETFPDEVNQRNWWLLYRDELIQDVIDNALNQKKEATLTEINKALTYYNHADCFMDLLNPENNRKKL